MGTSSRRWSPTSTLTATAALSSRCSPCSMTTPPTRSPSATSPAWLRSSERPSTTRSSKTFNQSDKDGDGEINFDEFYRIMKKKGNFLEDLSSDDDMEAAPKKSSRR